MLYGMPGSIVLSLLQRGIAWRGQEEEASTARYQQLSSVGLLRLGPLRQACMPCMEGQRLWCCARRTSVHALAQVERWRH
jgi:hypothetical protein